MRHPDLAAEIRRAVAEDRYEDAEALLPEYTRAVTEECISRGDQANFEAARVFLRATLISLRSRRAHLALRLHEVMTERPYVVARPKRHDVDMTG